MRSPKEEQRFSSMRERWGTRAWFAVSAMLTILGIGGLPDDVPTILGWLAAMDDVVAGVLIGAGGLGVVLYLWVRFGDLARSAWLATVGTRVKFAADMHNDPATIPPLGWTSALVRRRRKPTVLRFDGGDLRDGHLKVLLPLDCAMRTRSPAGWWVSHTTRRGVLYVSEGLGLGPGDKRIRGRTANPPWPMEVAVWLLFDPVGAKRRKETVAAEKRLGELTNGID